MIRLLNIFLVATLVWYGSSYYLHLTLEPYFDTYYPRVYVAILLLVSIVTFSAVSTALVSSLSKLGLKYFAMLGCAVSTYYLLFALIPFHALTTARHPNAEFFDALRMYFWNYSHQVYFLTTFTCVSVLLGAVNARAIRNDLIGALRMATLENFKRLIVFLRTTGTNL